MTVSADEQLENIAQFWREGNPMWAGIASNFLAVHRSRDVIAAAAEVMQRLQPYWPESIAVQALTNRLFQTTERSISPIHALGNARNLWAARGTNDMSKTAVSQLFFGLSRYLNSGVPRDAQSGLAAMIAILVENSDTPADAFAAVLEFLKGMIT